VYDSQLTSGLGSSEKLKHEYKELSDIFDAVRDNKSMLDRAEVMNIFQIQPI
jgi:hypothetical protein